MTCKESASKKRSSSLESHNALAAQVLVTESHFARFSSAGFDITKLCTDLNVAEAIFLSQEVCKPLAFALQNFVVQLLDRLGNLLSTLRRFAFFAR